MTRGIVAGYTLGLILTGAVLTWAQGGGCGQGNPNCVVPTPPLSDSSNRAANTSWVNQFLGTPISAITTSSLSVNGPAVVNGPLNVNGAIVDTSGNITASSITAINAIKASTIVDQGLSVAGSVCNSSTGIFFTSTSSFCPGQTTTIVASSISFSPTVSGIVGTTVGDNANPGVVGEYISQSVIQASGLTLSSAVAKSISAISLTAGDWDVEAHCDVNFPSGTASLFVCTDGSTQNSIGVAPNNGGYAQIQGVTLTGNANEGLSTGRQRFILSAPSTIYFTVEVISTVSATAWGFIGARRMR